MLERLQERPGATPLNLKQHQILQEYRSGRLRQEANKLTMISGHGRLKSADTSFVDIDGSTGGFVRTVLEEWGPPDLKDFEGDWRLGEDLRLCGQAP